MQLNEAVRLIANLCDIISMALMARSELVVADTCAMTLPARRKDSINLTEFLSSTRSHRAMAARIEDGVAICLLHAVEPASFSKRRVMSVWKVGSSLLGSRGGRPPLGGGQGDLRACILKHSYVAASSSNQKPVLRPVLRSWSWEVRTIRTFVMRFGSCGGKA
jgi:hypothetical protein